MMVGSGSMNQVIPPRVRRCAGRGRLDRCIGRIIANRCDSLNGEARVHSGHLAQPRTNVG